MKKILAILAITFGVLATAPAANAHPAGPFHKRPVVANTTFTPSYTYVGRCGQIANRTLALRCASRSWVR